MDDCARCTTTTTTTTAIDDSDDDALVDENHFPHWMAHITVGVRDITNRAHILFICIYVNNGH